MVQGVPSAHYTSHSCCSEYFWCYVWIPKIHFYAHKCMELVIILDVIDVNSFILDLFLILAYSSHLHLRPQKWHFVFIFPNYNFVLVSHLYWWKRSFSFPKRPDLLNSHLVSCVVGNGIFFPS